MKSLILEIKHRTKNKFKFLYSHFESSVLGFVQRKQFTGVKTFCLFVGYPRSGHTLVASLLNAHPNISIGIEYGLLLYIKLLKCNKYQIYHALTKNSKNYSEKLKNRWTGYSYDVPDSWQGKYSSLQVIGDKNGGANSSLLIKNPELLDELENVIKLKPKLIHVIRNPFDIITTVTFRKFEKRKITDPPSDEDLLPMIEKFLLRADSVMKIKSQNNFEIFDLYHEDFIKNPKFNLEKLVAFLGIDADNGYLEACSSIVYSSPHKSRLKIEWPEELIKYVESKLLKYPFLKHYKYVD